MFSFHPGDHRGFGGKSNRVQSFILSDSDINIRRKAPALIFKVRRLILRKGFWEVGGLNAFCLLCPSDSNWLTSREQSSCWGQKAYRSGGELRLCRSPSWQMGQDHVFCAPPGNLGGQWRRSLRQNVAGAGASSVCKNTFPPLRFMSWNVNSQATTQY